MKNVIIQNGSGEIVEKKSRFIGEIVKVSSPDEALEYVEKTRKKYFDAKHHCYAYVCGSKGEQERCSDDGEPSKTAGAPLLSILKSNDITDALIVVTRYFGGVLLGPGGLLRAYKAAGEAALGNAVTARITEGIQLVIHTDYKNENTVRHLCKNLSENGMLIEITEVAYSDTCDINVECEMVSSESLISYVTEKLSGEAEFERIKEIRMFKGGDK